MKSPLMFRLLFLVLSCAGKTDSIRRRLNLWDNARCPTAKRLWETINGQEWDSADPPVCPKKEDSSANADSPSGIKWKYEQLTLRWFMEPTFHALLATIGAGIGAGVSGEQWAWVMFLVCLTLLGTSLLYCNLKGWKDHTFITMGTFAFGISTSFFIADYTNPTVKAWSGSCETALVVAIMVLVPMLTYSMLSACRNCKAGEAAGGPVSHILVDKFNIIAPLAIIQTTAMLGGGAWFVICNNAVLFSISLSMLFSLAMFVTCFTQTVQKGNVAGFFKAEWARNGTTLFATVSTFVLVQGISCAAMGSGDVLLYALGSIIAAFPICYFLFSRCAVRNQAGTAKLATFYKGVTITLLVGGFAGGILAFPGCGPVSANLPATEKAAALAAHTSASAGLAICAVTFGVILLYTTIHCLRGDGRCFSDNYFLRCPKAS